MFEGPSANFVAYAAILGWPLVAFAIYRLRPFPEAIAWTVLGALLILPSRVAIKIPMIPALDKSSVGSLAALLGCSLFSPSVRRRAPYAPGIVAALILAYVFSPVITSGLNNDPVIAGPVVIPGVGYYDGVSALLSQLIFFLPFLIGKRFLANGEHAQMLLRVLVAASLIYSLPMFFEIRMSPQLSQWIYGTFSSSYDVEARYGGFRPVVFMSNGLALAFFLSTSIIAAVSLWRIRARISGFNTPSVIAYLGVLLLLCKSAGALIYSLLIGPIVLWITPKAQMRIAVVLAAIAITYPILRMSDLVPTSQILELASSINQDRAKSLGVRFEQEKRLLDHATERTWFGWGRYGRNRVYDDYGKDISITDGQWILTLGQFGLVGFIAQFGLLTFPIFRAATALKHLRSEREKVLLAATALILAVTAVEQLPNASINSWTWLLGGALYGFSSTALSLKAARPIDRRRSDSAAVMNR